MPKEKILIPAQLDYSRLRNLFESRNGGKIQAKEDKGVTNIDLYGEIGFWGIDAARFRMALREAGDINLRINSPGGDVFDGIAMYNDLVDHKGTVNIVISGLAASAASIVAMAGDTIQIHESARMMIHNAWGVVLGNRHDMREMATVLDGIDDSLARIYAKRTSVGIRSIKSMMDAETWIGSKAAVEQGFADSLVAGESDAKASWNLNGFRNTPEDLLQPESEEQERQFTIREFERILRDAGATHKQAREYAALLRPDGHRDDVRNPSPQRDVEANKGSVAAQFLFEINLMTETKRRTA